MIKTLEVTVKTNKSEELVDITDQIKDIVKKENIKHGRVYLFVPHTTGAVTINENTDPNVKKDMLFSLRQAFPIEKEHLHFEGNSYAHIKSSVIGNDQTIIIENHQLKLGRWQNIYFCEFDGPRQRSLYIQLIGE
jgi:secondary thiamine-phosphate synthase enzyme